MEKTKYYVYTVSVGEDIVYVGKGKDSRMGHVTSGASHNSNLNELYFRHKLLGEELPLVEVYPCVSERVALAYEHLLVKRYNPRFNCSLKYTNVKWYSHVDDEYVREFVEDNYDNKSFMDIPETVGLTYEQVYWIYEDVCGYEIPSYEDILSIAVSHSNLYGKELSCEYVKAISDVRDNREGM